MISKFDFLEVTEMIAISKEPEEVKETYETEQKSHNLQSYEFFLVPTNKSLIPYYVRGVCGITYPPHPPTPTVTEAGIVPPDPSDGNL